MLIKQADDRAQDINTLQALLTHPDATVVLRKKILKQIESRSKGVSNEKDAAYYIDFNFAPAPNWAVIHDLRLEHKGRTAQIDHILISRFMEIWVCESKYWSEGIEINARGEFTAIYETSAIGVPSPVEQNRRHISVLNAMIKDKTIALPKRLGRTIKPYIRSVILVSTNAKINRPQKHIDGLETIIKSDQFRTHIEKSFDKGTPLEMLRLVKSSTLESIAKQIAELHRPHDWDWHAKFGLSKPSSDPLCPKCNIEMVLRTAGRGKNKGKSFWGCSKFPKCRSVIEYLAN